MFLRVVLLATAFMSATATASVCDNLNALPTSLSVEEVGKINKACSEEAAKLKALAERPEVLKVLDTAPEVLDKAEQLAKTVSLVVRDTAKELNVAVNEFVTTPVGMLTVGAALVYVGGDYAVDFVNKIWSAFWASILLVGVHIACSKFRHFVQRGTPVEVRRKTWFGFGQERISWVYPKSSWEDMEEDQVILTVVSYIVQLVVLLVLTCKFII